MTICTNGYISFASSNTISPLPFDLDTRYSGGIYYQNLNSQSNDFNSIKLDLNRLSSQFVPTNLFRITYLNVPNYGSGSLLASFQIILATDSVKTFVLLKYTSCLSGSSTSFTTTPGIYFQDANYNSLSTQITTNPCTTSNVNLAGTWVYDVTQVSSSIILFKTYFVIH